MSPTKTSPTSEDKVKEYPLLTDPIRSKRDSLSNSKTELFIVENGWEMYVGEMEFKYGLMEQNIKVNGKMVKLTELVNNVLLRKVHSCRWRCL